MSMTVICKKKGNQEWKPRTCVEKKNINQLIIIIFIIQVTSKY